MSTLDSFHADIEDPSATTAAGAASGGSNNRVRRHRRRRRQRRPSVAGGSCETTTDGSFRFSDTSEDDQSWHSSMGSVTGISGAGGGGGGGSYDECVVQDGASGFSSGPRRPARRRGSCVDDDVDLECGELEMKKVNNDANKQELEVEEEERDCRICHLSLLGNGINNGIGVSIELGCACKGDLGTAHKQCAETWFKIRGNTTCEICGALAINIAGEQTIETSNTSAAAPVAPALSSERRSFCHGRRVMNFLLACMIFAFVISWLFHFHVLT